MTYIIFHLNELEIESPRVKLFTFTHNTTLKKVIHGDSIAYTRERHWTVRLQWRGDEYNTRAHYAALLIVCVPWISCDRNQVMLHLVYPYNARIFLYQPWRPKGFHQFEILIIVCIS